MAGCHFLRPADGVTRPTRTGRRSARRVWRCASCRRQFSVLTGTVLERTRIPIATWLAATASVRRGETPTARDLRERHDLTTGTAARIAAVLGAVAGPEPTSGASGDSALAALLTLDPDDAGRVRTSVRRYRPRMQLGPIADYGPGD